LENEMKSLLVLLARGNAISLPLKEKPLGKE
jgi:hypothetical protein